MKKIYKVKVNGKAYEVELQEVTSVEGVVESNQVASKSPTQSPSTSGGEGVPAPMPGVITDIKVNVGDTVAKGQLVAILEAMKMETEIFAPCDGSVVAINVEKGAQVNLGDAIVSLG